MQVSLFVTCICDAFFPQVGKAVVNILEHQGVQVDFPQRQVCCGQPSYNTGYWKETREVAKGLLEAFKDSEYVVAPSGSCVAAIKEYYPKMFAEDTKYRPLVDELVRKVYEFSMFQVEVMKQEDLGATFPHKVTYHPNCHSSRFLGVNPSVLSLLSHVRDLDFIELPRKDDCCGFGGTFSVKMGEVSGALVDEKAHHVMASGAEVLTGTDMGCLMNIGGRLQKEGSKIRTLHIVELLAEGMRL